MMAVMGNWWTKLQKALRQKRTDAPDRDSLQQFMEALEDRSLMTSGVTANFLLTQDWGSGFQGQIQLQNQQAASVNNWTLELEFDANITSIWDAKIVSQVGNRYTITNAGWNNTLAGGGTVSFGFVASPGNTTAIPTNLKLNGVPLDGGPTDPAPVPALTITDANVLEGNSGTTDAVFTIRLSAASVTPVTVQYSTVSGTAESGSDYQQKSGTLTFGVGETEKSIAVTVIGDTDVEPDETFRMRLSNATGASIADSEGVGMIQNDDVQSSPTSDFEFRVQDNWGSGFTGEIVAIYRGTVPLEDWRLELDYDGNISAIWNAAVESHVGNRYVIKAPSWNKTIAPGGSISFGFTATPGNAAAPTNFVLRSASGQNPGGVNQPPVANNDHVVTTAGQAVSIQALANDRDPNGDPFAIESFTQAEHGVVSLGSDGSFTYTPAAGFIGNDSFTYVIADGRGGLATGTVSVVVAQQSVWPEQVFAPYVDMTLYPMFDLAAAAQASGVRYFTLAFIVADPAGRPSWGGYSEYAVGQGEFDAAVRTQLAAIRAMSGDVIVSFGGASNHELAQVITDATQLKNAYQSVIDAYGLRVIDFDIEGAASADRASIDRRSQAIAALQRDAAAAGKSLAVHFTLPVLPTGLTNDGLYVLQSAVRFGVDISVVNIMAMDYGDSAAPNPEGRMGDYAIEAASSLFAQLRGLYGMSKTEAQTWGMIGVTPMIGLNDVVTETFDQQEARELLEFAEEKGLALLSMWSLNRDRSHPSGEIGYVEPTSSSIVQSPLEFSILFNDFLE